jgi:hypothetical protein
MATAIIVAESIAETVVVGVGIQWWFQFKTALSAEDISLKIVKESTQAKK